MTFDWSCIPAKNIHLYIFIFSSARTFSLVRVVVKQESVPEKVGCDAVIYRGWISGRHAYASTHSFTDLLQPVYLSFNIYTQCLNGTLEDQGYVLLLYGFTAKQTRPVPYVIKNCETSTFASPALLFRSVPVILVLPSTIHNGSHSS